MRKIHLEKNIFRVFGFSVAMAFLETAVVVYLRTIYYPEGFEFPLVPVTGIHGITELLREAATLIMLLMVSILAAKEFTSRFAYFLYSFAIWDIFYYVFLKILLGWPESFLTWDILFLLPVPWFGPVVAPLINSLSMIMLALVILFHPAKKKPQTLGLREWLLLITGSIIIIFSYTVGYAHYMLEKFTVKTLLTFSEPQAILEHSSLFIPSDFPWWIFWIGQGIIFLGIILYFVRIRKLRYL